MNSWINRRWYEFRTGHGSYLVFGLTFANFILIAYRLLVEKVPELNSLFPHLYDFVVIFVIAYTPLAIIIGHWHRKTQLATETSLYFLSNPLAARFYRLVLELQQGKASKEEVDQMMRLLSEIERKQGG